MAAIPKSIVDRFLKTVPKFQQVLRSAKDRDLNESDTVSIISDIFGETLGYDKYLEVTSEFAIRGTYCDLAVKIEDKVQFLIEVKAIGIELKAAHMRQAIDYGANHGVQWVVLTNGIQWRLYRIRFEQPIDFDLVCTFDFLTLKSRSEKDQECLFMLAKEGLSKSSRENFYEKVQSLNRYVIGSLILTEPVLAVIRRELKKLSDGMKINIGEVEQIVRAEVLKREVVEGDEAEEAKNRVRKFYRKCEAAKRARAKAIDEEVPAPAPSSVDSISEEPLDEADKAENDSRSI